MESVVFRKNVVQIFVLVVILTRVDSARIPAKAVISNIQEIPQYRFHYYVQNDKTKPYEEYKNGEKAQGSYSEADSKGDIEIDSYRSDKSNGPVTNVNTQASASPFQISLNNPVYNTQSETKKDLTIPSEASPIIVEPIKMQEQKSSKSIQMDSKNEYHLEQNTDKSTPLIEQRSTNETEDRKDDIKDEQATDQILIQDEGTTSKQIEFTVPFKKPNTVNANDFKYDDNEDLKKDIVKVIQNINGEYEQTDPQIHFKSEISNKPLKIFGLDSVEMDQQESYQQNHEGNSNFKSQQLSNKPLKLIGYNPSTFASLYDMPTDYNRPSQIKQTPNPFNQGNFVGYGVHENNVKPQTHDNSGIYLSQPNLMFHNGNYKGNQKYYAPTPTQQPLYYYDPNSMVMLPVYTNMVQNAYPYSVENKRQPTYPFIENKPQPAYPFIENKPQPAYPTVEIKPQPSHKIIESKPQPVTENKPQLQADSNKSGFNLMQILSGGSFYKSSEQAESSQQTTVKESVKQETNKFEKSKSEMYDKSKPQQTLMFYLNPGETPIDLKSLTSGPVQLTLGQQPQTECDGKTLKPLQIKPVKPLQPIPLCSDCVPALGLMGLPSTAIQQKKSIGAPQVMPLWNGPNFSKLNYLILPTPITK